MDWIGGADEVGYGSYAGPGLVCLVLAPVEWSLSELKDSKAFGSNREKAHLARSAVYDSLMAQEPFIRSFLSWVPPETIDRKGLGRAFREAFAEVVQAARTVQPDAEIILDGNIHLKGFSNIRSMHKADATVATVSAASIIAKVERDRYMMTEADSEYPQYGFIDHVGYGVPQHIAALDKYGPCPLHRFSFRSIAKYGTRSQFQGRQPVRADLLPEEVIF